MERELEPEVDESLAAEPDADERVAARHWVDAAVDECVEHFVRTGRRYARRVREQDLARDAVADVMSLAARRCAPLPSRVIVPLAPPPGGRAAEAYNRLEHADRRALAHLGEIANARCSARDPRTEHLASALQRLVETVRTVGAGSR